MVLLFLCINTIKKIDKYKMEIYKENLLESDSNIVIGDNATDSDSPHDNEPGHNQEDNELYPEHNTKMEFTNYNIPNSLLELYEKNPETYEFVNNYSPEKKSEFNIDLANEKYTNSIPYFFQWDERWGYEIYGEDFLAITGCGPTCLAMVACGLRKDTVWNPLEVAKLSESKNYYVDGIGTSWQLFNEGVSEIGLKATEVILWEDTIKNKLEAGTPLICSMDVGDFADKGH